MPRSQVATGFHRLGIVLATPFLVLALALAFVEWKDPSGPLKEQLPEGTAAYRFGHCDFDAAAQQILSAQRAAGFSLPDNMMLIGQSGETAILNGVEWTKFRLWDGREIGIATKEKKNLSTVARHFLLNEAHTKHPYNDKDNIEIDAAPVKFLNSFEQYPPASPPWLVKTHNWGWPVVSFSLAVVIYIGMWALAWVITGFSQANT